MHDHQGQVEREVATRPARLVRMAKRETSMLRLLTRGFVPATNNPCAPLSPEMRAKVVLRRVALPRKSLKPINPSADQPSRA